MKCLIITIHNVLLVLRRLVIVSGVLFVHCMICIISKLFESLDTPNHGRLGLNSVIICYYSYKHIHTHKCSNARTYRHTDIKFEYVLNGMDMRGTPSLQTRASYQNAPAARERARSSACTSSEVTGRGRQPASPDLRAPPPPPNS